MNTYAIREKQDGHIYRGRWNCLDDAMCAAQEVARRCDDDIEQLEIVELIERVNSVIPIIPK